MHRLGSIVDFECDRAILTAAEGAPADRLSRLVNVGQCPSWNVMPDALARYRALVAESGLDARRQAELLERFRATHPLRR